MTKSSQGAAKQRREQSVAEDIMGDDPEPPGGWRLFDGDGNRVNKAGKRLKPSRDRDTP
jgi:hypothetical protein